jgi:peptide-methionine (R)-S-oxide reductase
MASANSHAPACPANDRRLPENFRAIVREAPRRGAGRSREYDRGADWPRTLIPPNMALMRTMFANEEEPMMSTAHPDTLANLSPLQYAVTQEAATEPAFSGIYWDNHEAGTYHCVVCATPLFDSGSKFESGTGWPSFGDVVDNDRVTLIEDRQYGMRRTEVRCASCGAHLGHLFPDGPGPTGLRYCINSASLDFAAREGQGDEDDPTL